MMKGGSLRYVVIVGIPAIVLLCGFIYHTGYTRGLQAGLEWAKGNTQSALVRELGVLRSVDNEKSRAAIWGAFSAELRELLITERMTRSAGGGILEHLKSLTRGDQTIYYMSRFVRPIGERVAEVQEVCRKITAEREYTRYCEELVTEYKTELGL